MPSPQPHQSQAPRTFARRRQRSTRLVVALSLLVLATVVVIGALVWGSPAVLAVAAVFSILAGVAATRITQAELTAARREAARDRAAQSQAYLVLTERRTAENVAFAADMARKIGDRENAIDVLERALSTALHSVAEQTLKHGQEARRADIAEGGLKASDERAAEAIVRLAELESEIDVMRSELAALQSAASRRVDRSA